MGIDLLIVLQFSFDRIIEEDLNSLHRNTVTTENLARQGMRPLEENVNLHLLMGGFPRNTLFMMTTESIMNSAPIFPETIKPDTEYLKKLLSCRKELYRALKDKDLRAA